MKIYVMVLCLALLSMGCTKTETQNIQELNGTAELTLGQCMTKAGAVMYGTEWCPHCQEQKRRFGDDFKNVNYVDCDRQQNRCVAAGVQGYPTWYIDGKSYAGTQELSRLAELTGCDRRLNNGTNNNDSNI